MLWAEVIWNSLFTSFMPCPRPRLSLWCLFSCSHSTSLPTSGSSTLWWSDSLGGTSYLRLPNGLDFLKGLATAEPGASLRCNTFDILAFQKIRSSDVAEMWREKLKLATENHKVTGKRSINIASEFLCAFGPLDRKWSTLWLLYFYHVLG